MYRMLTPRVTTQNANRRQVGSFEWAPSLQGFDGVMGTRGLIATFIRTQKRRKRHLVNSNQ